jgi:CRISPR/Cas system-associated exonuclease Cas4 (RecB family)
LLRGLYHAQDDKAFNTLYGAVAMEITRDYNVDEYTIQEAFKENIDKIFNKKAKLIKRKNNLRHIPDAWIQLENEDIPVEVKLSDFDNKALKQLKRYMTFYKCKKGIAVGKKYTANKEENITFIPIDSFFEY